MELDAAVAAIAAAHHGLFAQHHLHELEVTKHLVARRLAAGRWERLYEDVYRMAGAPPSWRASLLAACWAGGHRAVASHRSAAALWGLPSGRQDLTEITCPRWRRARHDGLVVHESMALNPSRHRRA